MIVKLLTEHHLDYLSLKGGCTGSSESTHIKMPHCWKSHVAAHINYFCPPISGSTELTRSISVLVRSYKGLVLCLSNKSDTQEVSINPLLHTEAFEISPI